MKFTSLLADIRLSAPGMPEPWQYRFLTRSLQQFLSESQCWQEWSTYAWDFTNASGGLYAPLNAKYDPATSTDSFSFVRTDRILKVRWVPTGELIEKVTLDDMDASLPDWESHRGKQPRYWVPYNSAFNPAGVPAARFVGYPESSADDAVGALKFYLSHTIVELETPEMVYQLDNTLSNSGIADWVFRRYRDTIVAGALAKALVVPGVDWSNERAAMFYGNAFREGTVKARSETEAGHTNSVGTVTYGGY